MTTGRRNLIRALILDLGNVLIFHDNKRLMRELAVACGCTPEAVLAALRPEVSRRINTTDGDPSLVFDAVAPAIGFPGDLDAFSAIWNGIFTPNDELVPVIESLCDHLSLLVLSNTNAMHMAYIRPRLMVLQCFDAVLTSCELGLMKPDVAIYEAALRVAGVAPFEAAFFDDLPEHVEGARRAGLHAFLFTDAAGFTRDLAALGLWHG